MPSPDNLAIIAAAGARKTQTVIDRALAPEAGRVLVTTYTNENLRQIASRTQAVGGTIPPNVRLAGWFSFLLSDCVRPYQASLLGQVGVVGGLNFVGKRPQYVRSDAPRRYYLDRGGDVYRDEMAALVCRINEASAGAVIERLESLYDEILVDEVQDLVGWDLEILDLLFASRIRVTVVGDPRQHTFSTNQGTKNKKYRGAGLVKWLEERSEFCKREHRDVSHRCHADICEFASRLFPDMPPMRSGHDDVTGHDGIVTVSPFDVLTYFEEHRPQVLRRDKRANTYGLPAMNIGVSKGSTFDRVLIVPTNPMREYLEHRDPSRLKAPESLYVAVTRARHSVAFVV